jgi:polyhydroxyalkanoate depolymerase
MAGPVDPRISPTQVNELAHSRPLSWFERNCITTVPGRYRGAGRRVYPGFLQLAAFVGMNATRHWSRQVSLYDRLIQGLDGEADAIKSFYDEYFAVLDMTAEFYLETVDSVFQKALLPRGEMVWRGQSVDVGAITDTALLTVEGDRDDICGAGQTFAAHDLCSGIAPRRKAHHLQRDTGHYGIFAGRRWREEIYPVVRSFIQAHDG